MNETMATFSSKRPYHPAWWKVKKEDLDSAVFDMMEKLKASIQDREYVFRRWQSLYEGREIGGMRASDATALLLNLFDDKDKFKGLTLNVVQSCIDTICAQITSNEPRPMFLTEEGDWELKQQAKQLEKFVTGMMYDQHWAEEAREAFLDSAIFGTGFIKIDDDGTGNIICERVFPLEIIVDERAAMNNRPRSMFQEKEVSAEALAAKYPKFKDTIYAAADLLRFSDSQDIITTDLVRIVEAWHLPSTKDSQDGRHTIVVPGAVLLDESWTQDDFPFVVFRWTRRRIRYYAQGLSEQLEGIQLEINKLLRRIQDAMHLYSVANTYVEEGSLVSKGHLKNTSGNIVEYRKGCSPPRQEMPSSIASEVFNHVWRLKDAAYEIAGISQLSATSRKPAGIESGIAMQTLLDTETRRFAMISKMWEDSARASAEKFIDVAKRIHDGGKSVVSRYQGKGFINEIDWADIDLKKEEYVLKIWPVNLLPHTPSGKLDIIDKMIQRGMIDADEGQALMEFPDIEKFRSLKTAALDDIDATISDMLVNGQYEPPLPYQNLQLGIQRVVSSLLRARLDKAPEKRTQLLERWLEDASDMLQPNQQGPSPYQSAQMQAAPGEAAAIQPASQPPQMPPGAMPPGPHQ